MSFCCYVLIMSIFLFVPYGKIFNIFGPVDVLSVTYAWSKRRAVNGHLVRKLMILTTARVHE